MDNNLPVICLAFANSTDRPLPSLDDEYRRLKSRLQIVDGRLCEVVMAPYATVDEIFDTFQSASYRNRIAVFHFAGHANAYQLLLQSAEGRDSVANAGSLAAFLGRQQGLELVFLNACSTQPQVEGLLDAGVSIVIATSQNIDDAIATDFADRFYAGLAGGATVDNAYHEAESAALTKGSGEPRHFYSADNGAPAPDAADRWPWVIYHRQGAERASSWNLPEAASDPLFGLPDLPDMDLPQSPFRHLLWFDRAHAPVFFGRGYQIRELFQSVTGTVAEPIILFYGQSGVGKSSLLDAGLLPRLESAYSVVYARRDERRGLLRTLLDALDAQGDGADLGSAWRAVEQRDGRPLIAVLDQVEEVFTHPGDTATELDDLLCSLAALFADRNQRPRGKLILGFRKEWLAEVEEQLAARKLPHAKTFLQRLDRRGIIEAVEGVAKSPSLSKRYGLSVEDGLSGVIADAMLEDEDSPIAPTLQILLTKMWLRATEQDPDSPKFTVSMYQELRKQGILLKDFLDQQMATLAGWNREAVESGLALDVLAYHTTNLGTAAQSTAVDLREQYRHRDDVLPELVQQFKDAYLLTDAAGKSQGEGDATRLAHDALAPLIRREFDESDLPGQRARRVLENRASDFVHGGALLDDPDLATAEAGRNGMRAWNDAEEELVHVSAVQRKRRRRNRRMWQTLGVAAVAAIVVVAIVALWQWREAKNQTAIANEKTELAAERLAEANRSRGLARGAAMMSEEQARAARRSEWLAARDRDEARRQASIARSRQLAAESVGEFDNGRYETALLLAIEAGRPRDGLEFFNREASNILRAAVAQPGHAAAVLYGHEMPVDHVAWSPDGSRIVTASSDGTARVWDGVTGGQVSIMDGHDGTIYSASWNHDGTQVLTAGYDRTARICDADSGEELVSMEGHTGWITRAAWNADGSKVVTASADGSARIWDASSGAELVRLLGHRGGVNDAVWSEDGSKVLTASDDRTARIWDASSGQTLVTMDGHSARVNGARWRADGAQVLTSSEDNTARIWDAMSGQQVVALEGHTNYVAQADWSGNGLRVLTASGDNTARIWDAETGDELHTLQGHSEYLVRAIWSAGDSRVLTASHDGTARIWDADSGEELVALLGNGGKVNDAAWTADAGRIATAGWDSTVRIWDTALGQELVTLRGHGASVYQAVWNASGTQILTASGDGTARIWDAASGETEATMSGHGGGVYGAVWSHDGARVLSVSHDHTARIWDTVSGEERAVLRGHDTHVFRGAWSSDDNRVLTASGDGTARIWDANTGEQLARLQGHRGAISEAVWEANDARVVTASADFTARIWDSNTGGELVRLQGHTLGLRQATWSADGTQILTASDDGTARLWDATTGDEVVRLVGHAGAIFQAEWSADGTRILTASQDTTARIWDAVSGRELVILEGHKDWTNGAVWSADGSQALTFSWDRTARIWDTATGKELATLEGHTMPVLQASWNADGTRILTASSDGTVRLWYARNEDLFAAACERAPRNLALDEWNRYMGGDYEPTCAQAAIPPDAIGAVVAGAADYHLAGEPATAKVRLEALNGWLHSSGQFEAYGVDIDEFLATLASE